MADSVKTTGVKSVIDFLDPTRLRKKVVRPVINKTTRALKKDAENTMAGMKGKKGVFNIPKKRVKEGTSLELMKQHSVKEEATVTFDGGRPSLQHFSNNKKLIKKKKSPRFRIKKAKSLETLERGFPLNKAGASKRATGLFQRKGKESTPIVRRTGPSPKQMYEDKDVHLQVEARKAINQEEFFRLHFNQEYGGKK